MAFNRSGATQTVVLDISKAFNRVWHADLPHKLKSYGISGQVFGLKGLFLALHFSCCILMTSPMMLSVILLSMLMILVSILSVIGHLTCGNNLNWLLNLNLTYETLWTGERSGLLISMLGKLSWCCLTILITMVLLM